jgi:hypothetical protein
MTQSQLVWSRMGATLYSVTGGTLVLFNGRCIGIPIPAYVTADLFRQSLQVAGIQVHEEPTSELEAARLLDPTFTNMAMLPASRFDGVQVGLFS